MYCIPHCILCSMQHLNISNVVVWQHSTNLFNLVTDVQNILHFLTNLVHYLIFERKDGHLMLFLFTLQLLLQFSDVLKSHTGRKIQCIFSMTVMDAAVCLQSINLCRCASVPESDPEALTAVFRPLPRVCKCLSSYSLSGHPSIALQDVQQMGFNIREFGRVGPSGSHLVGGH